MAKISTRANPKKTGRHEADLLYQAIQQTKIPAPSTDCVAPIGEELILKGLRQVVPGEFYAAATRPPAVYRGNPFQIEVGLAYGGTLAVQRVSLEALRRDARRERRPHAPPVSLDQFPRAGHRRGRQDPDGGRGRHARFAGPAQVGRHRPPAPRAAKRQHQRWAVDERAPLRQPRAAAIPGRGLRHHANRHGDQLAGVRPEPIAGGLPSGPVTVMVHMASVWVPFTNESKEAVAGYPEIQKELRLGLQAVGRKLGMFLRRRLQVRHEGERRQVFLRYVGEVATAVSRINATDRQKLYELLLETAKTAHRRSRHETRRPGQTRRGRRGRFWRECNYRGAGGGVRNVSVEPQMNTD